MKVEPVSFIERQYKEMFLNLIYIQHIYFKYHYHTLKIFAAI